MKIKIIDLFAGIGGIRLGFEAHDCECVFSSEWDADAQKMYEANYGHKPHGDITQIAEFPASDNKDFTKFYEDRNYNLLTDGIWI